MKKNNIKLTDNLIKLCNMFDKHIAIWTGCFDWNKITNNQYEGSFSEGFESGWYFCNIQFACRVVKEFQLTGKIKFDDDKELLEHIMKVENKPILKEIIKDTWVRFEEYKKNYNPIKEGCQIVEF